MAHLIAILLAIAFRHCGSCVHRHQSYYIQKRSRIASDSINSHQTALRPLTSIALVPHIAIDARHDLTQLTVPFIRQTGFGISWPNHPSDMNDDNHDHLVDGVDLNEAVCECPDNIAAEQHMESKRVYAFRSVYGSIFDSFTGNAISWNVVILICINYFISSINYQSFSKIYVICFFTFNYILFTFIILSFYYDTIKSD